MTFRLQNLYRDDHFPERWGEDDIEYLAEFLEAEFNAELVEIQNPQRDYDYSLFKECDAE
jgi:hypothetical protein